MAKELNEQEMKDNLEREMSLYDEDNYFKRLGKMFVGFSKPRSSREYKAAVIELQRQSAPLTALMIPLVGVIVLAVVSAVGSKQTEEIKVEVAQAAQEEAQLEEIEPPPETEPPPDVEVEVAVDTPVIGNPNEIANASPASNEPVSPKVSAVDTMLNISSPVTMKSVFGSQRSTGVRGKYSSGGAGYGDASTEAAVMKALRWLKYTQRADGSWIASEGYKSSIACTGFAVLTYLAHGETPGSKEFGETVQKALDYLVSSVKENKHGTTIMNAGANSGDASEYSFLIGTYALSESYGMTRNPNIKEAAEKCIRRIVSGQTPTGGWNYNLKQTSTGAPDDISFGGWAIQALKAAKMAGIHVERQDACIRKAIKCLKTRNADKTYGFLYRPGSRHSWGLGGVGCLAMQLLGYGRDPEARTALDVMRNWQPAFDPKDPASTTRIGGGWACPQYYFYYASQCKYQAGMAKGASTVDAASWKKWNAAMKKLYPSSIVTLQKKIKGPDGKDHAMGYWKNSDKYSARPVMDTCLCALQLMVYYRYLPTTSLKAAEVEADIDALSKDSSGEVGVVVDI